VCLSGGQSVFAQTSGDKVEINIFGGFSYWGAKNAKTQAGNLINVKPDRMRACNLSPDDIVPWQAAQAIPGHSYRVGARSVVMLYALAQSAVGPATRIPPSPCDLLPDAPRVRTGDSDRGADYT
jgi:hypothetical protein